MSEASPLVKEDSPILLKEQQQKENERVWTSVLSTLVVSMMAFMLGCTLGYPSPVLLQLENAAEPELRFNSVLSGVFGAIALVSAIFTGSLAGWVGDKWGRKMSLMLCAQTYLFGYFLIVSASISAAPKPLLLLGRFITGFGVSWVFQSVPVYIGEISSAKLRGLLSSFSELFLAAGVLFVYGIGAIPGFQYYNIALVLEGVVLLYMLLVVWIPETPHWLLAKNMKEQAVEVMVFLRGPKAKLAIARETEAIENAVSKAPHLTIFQSLKELRRKSVLVPFILVVAVIVLQQATGVGIVNAYTAPIFQKAGVEDPQIAAISATGGAQFIATAVGVFLVDLVGRRPLLIVGTSGMFAGATMLGTHFYITRPALCAMNSTTNATTALVATLSDTAKCNTQYAPLAIVSVLLYIVSFAVSWGPVPWAIASEYLPLQVRGFGTGIGATCAMISASVVIGVYPVYADFVNPWFAWWTFSVINLAALVFVVVCIVETKGKSLEEIQRYFETKYSKDHTHLKQGKSDSTKLLEIYNSQ